MKPLRVGLNLLFLGERAGGVGRYALELVEHVAACDGVDVDAFLGWSAPSKAIQRCLRAGARVTRVPLTREGSRVRIAGEYGALPALALARGVDVLHSPANAGPVRVPGIACVVTVHDVIWRRAGDAWGTAAAQRSMDRVIGRVARNADLVITGSHDTEADLVTELGVAQDRLRVVYHGATINPSAPAASPAALRERFALGAGPVLLCVAQKRGYKNHAAVVRALAALPDRQTVLVAPGASTPYEDELRALAVELGVADRVRLVDWVGDNELEGLYGLATALVLPSKIEGFGLPVLEAMGRGTPVVCSRTTALGEVAGDAAVLVDPDDQNEIDDAVARVVGDTDMQQALSAAGRRRAAEFTWSRTAAETVEVYRQALACRR